MKNIKYIYIVIVITSIMLSCGGSDGAPAEVQDPTKAILLFPNNNEECTAGVVTSNVLANLTFDWMAADNATSYTLVVKNLVSNTENEYSSNTNERVVSLERGTPYSWYVISKASGTSVTATSDTWKFYLSGPGVENYAPFPADLKSPSHGSSISETSITMTWEGEDVDGDLKEFDIYLDTNSAPSTKMITTTDNKLENQAVNAGTTYYWKVVSHDNYGNTSTSQVFSFTTI
ncbi:MAG: hypothetical protein ACON5F_03265 [Jejuia sp.]